MTVQIVNPEFPDQIWYIGDLTWTDGTPSDGAWKKEQAKRFANFLEIGEALDKFASRFPIKQVIIEV